MNRRIVAVLALVSTALVLGCGGQELGPMDPSKVQKVSDEEVQKQMLESQKYLPQGAKVPESVLPQQPAPNDGGTR